MITLENLTENKNEIIEMIALLDDSSRTKELMTMMVKSIGARCYEDLSVMKFAKAVIKDNPAQLVITDTTAYYAEASKRQLGSSMK